MIIPPNDLLEGVQGVDQGLQKTKKLRGLGWFGLLASTLQFLALSVNSDWWSKLTDPDQLDRLVEQWPFVVSAGLLIFFTLLFTWSRVWLKESQQPFRYTCSVSDFEAVPPSQEDPSYAVAPRLRYDLCERLNERIARLSFLDDKHLEGDPHADQRSHVHVSGHFLLRQSQSGAWKVEVTPRIRMGGPKAPERLAHPVKFNLESAGEQESVEMISRDGASSGGGQEASEVVNPKGDEEPAGGEDAPGGEGDGRRASLTSTPPRLKVQDYEKILERVYFSIATEIYRQIREDVEHKISMLPTRRLRAVAYLYEAEDYARSTTLDAYEEARKLFAAAIGLFDPRREPPRRPKILHPFQSLARARTALAYWLRGWACWIWPRAGRRVVLAARAEIGYANTLIYRRVLAGLAGHRINPIFEARPVVQRALRRLEKLAPAVVGQKEARFNGYVAKVLIHHYLGAAREAREALEAASSLLPDRAAQDSRFLFASGLIEINPRAAVTFLRQSVELDPRFEVAQFERALRTEHVWRTRPTLEHSVAEIVIDEYFEVLKLNPGNIRAWANVGYIYWLLKNTRSAKDAYLWGRDYKEIRRTTYVAELDHGLARVYAEEGDFKAAYKYYLSAVGAQIAQGVDHQLQTSAQFYFFDFIGEAMLKRFRDYRDAVVTNAQRCREKGNGEITQRICNSVVAFALNDFGEACRDYYSRTGSKETLQSAKEHFELARKTNPRYVMPHFNLYLLASHALDRATSGIRRRREEALAHIRKVRELEPTWPDAILAETYSNALTAERAKETLFKARAEAEGPDDAAGAGEQRGDATGLPTPPYPIDEREHKSLQDLSKRAIERAGGPEGLQRLVPHYWLWRNKEFLGEEFNWKALRDTYVKEGRWQREIDDLHVKALFAWGMARYLHGRRAESGTKSWRHQLQLGQLSKTSDPQISGGGNVSLRRRVKRWLREQLLPRRLRKLLRLLREHFWLRNFGLLQFCLQMGIGDRIEDDLKDLIELWLKEDPAAYWALELVVNDELVSKDGRPLKLLEPHEKKRYLQKASEQEDLPPYLREWIESQLAGIDEREERARGSRDEEMVGDKP